MSVQKTFQSILGKFSDGIVVLSGIANYNPSKPELKIGALEELKKNAELKNSAVINTGITLKQLRSHRNVIKAPKRI